MCHLFSSGFSSETAFYMNGGNHRVLENLDSEWYRLPS